MYNDSFRLRYGSVPVAISTTENFKISAQHIHKEIEMLYIVSGSSQITISDKVFSVHKGDLAFVNPLEVHSIVANKEGEEYNHHCICFDTSLIADKELSKGLLNSAVFIENLFQSGQSVTERLSTLFLTLFDAVKNDSETLIFDANVCLSEMFKELLKAGKITKSALPKKKITFTKKVIVFLEMHYHEEISSKSVAKALFYTQSYFCRTFKLNFGIPFSSYLNMYRISSAKEKTKKQGQKNH